MAGKRSAEQERLRVLAEQGSGLRPSTTFEYGRLVMTVAVTLLVPQVLAAVAYDWCRMA